MHKIALFISLFIIHSLVAEIRYHLQFEGVPPKSEIEEVLNETSQLRLLQAHPPSTLAALRRRAEADLPNLIDGLQSLGYYDPHIELTIDTSQEIALVSLRVQTNFLFRFESFTIQSLEPIKWLSESIDFPVNSVAKPLLILEGEKKILNKLTASGYPKAKMVKQEVLANRLTHTIHVIYHVLSGPLMQFGQTEIIGLKNLKEDYIRDRIRWKEGDIFNPERIEQTQIELESSGLFGLVTLHQGEHATDSSRLPIVIELSESKHRTIASGISYTTQLGPGGMFEWENRNMFGRGRKLSLRTNIWIKRQNGFLSYQINNFLDQKQNLFLIAEIEREVTKGYDEKFVSLCALLELQITKDLQLSYGLSLKQLAAEKSEPREHFTLIKIPLHIRWSNANHLLNPTKGTSVNYKFTCTMNASEPSADYGTNFLTLTTYYSLTHDHSFVLAGKISLANIFGTKNKHIAASERLYAGSESLLRGYGYQTVSPLDEDQDKPVGGRSLMVYSLELRSQFTSSWGSVFFFDIGNVYAHSTPQFNHKQLLSAGAGLRYFTAVGPLRFDFAFPLNKRKKLDKNIQFYFSIGQTF